MSSRVAQAREQLQKRLSRRGVTLSAGLRALELGRAAVAQPLVDGTIKAALAQPALGGGLSTRLKLATAVLLVVGLMGGVGGLALLAFPASPPAARRAGEPQTPSGTGQKTLTDHLGDPLPPGVRLRMGSARLRHAGSVGPMVFSPDGKRLATGGSDNAIRLWDAATGRQTQLLLGHRSYLVALAFSADGKRLVSGSAHEAERFRLWDLSSGKQLWSCRPPGRLVYATAFAPDGRTVALANDEGLVVLLDAANGKERFRLQGQRITVLGLTFAPDGRSLAVCSDDGPVLVWDLATRKEALRSIGGRSVAFSADGKTLHISVVRYLPGDGASRGVGEVWDFAFPSGRPLRSHRYDPAGTAVAAVALAPDGKVGAALCWNGEIHFWDVASGKRLRTIAGRIVRPSPSDQLVFSSDGKRLAFGRSHTDRTVQLWDVTTGKALHPAGGHESLIRAVVVSPDGSRVATGSDDGMAILWDAATGKPLHTFRARGNVLSLAFSADGRRLALGGQSEASIHDVQSGKSLGKMQTPLRPFVVLAFTPDGKTLVSGRGHSLSRPERRPVVPESLRTWDAATGKALRSLETALFAASDSSPGLLVTPDGREALALHADQVVRGWDLKTGKDRILIRVCEPQVRLLSSAFSARGTLLAANLGTGPFRVWDLARGGRRLPVDIPDGFGQALAFSPDQRYLASAGMRVDDAAAAERTIRLWELATGKEAFRLALPPGNAVSWIAFLPDSRSLVAAMADTTVLIWDLRHLKTRAAPRLPR